MYLEDAAIHRFGRRLISPFDPNLVNPASYDITLSDNAFLRGDTPIKLPVDLQPGEFILVSSEQYLKFPCDVSGQLLLKSSLGRKAINHMLAGWFDPDFHGNATMELKNEGHAPFRLEPGQRVAQIVFHLGRPSFLPYRFKGRYHGQRDVTQARAQTDKSPTLDASLMWVVGPQLGHPMLVYDRWADEMTALLKTRPDCGGFEMGRSADVSVVRACDSNASSFPTLDVVEREHIIAALRRSNGHRGRTCNMLGISRPTLVRKIRKYGLLTTVPELQPAVGAGSTSP